MRSASWPDELHHLSIGSTMTIRRTLTTVILFAVLTAGAAGCSAAQPADAPPAPTTTSTAVVTLNTAALAAKAAAAVKAAKAKVVAAKAAAAKVAAAKARAAKAAAAKAAAEQAEAEQATEVAQTYQHRRAGTGGPAAHQHCRAGRPADLRPRSGDLTGQATPRPGPRTDIR
jgi:hypothetical protein